jgi:hypothetical protein
MLQQNDIEQAVDTYKIKILKALDLARKAVLPEPVILKFCTRTIDSNEIKKLSQKIPTGGRNEDKGSEFLYVYTISESCDVSYEEIEEAFKSGRDLQNQDNYPGHKNLCQPNKLSKGTKALYVGRSYKPRERFKQHVFESTSETFAIHFESWASNIHLHVNLYVYQFRELGDLTVQVIEDGLWDHLNPLLGKRGAK